MAIDMKNTAYTAKALLKDGSALEITEAILRINRQEPPEEIAQRVNIRIAQVQTPKGWLHNLLPLCTFIVLYADGKETFRGIVWEWEFSSSKQKEIDLMCYDHFIYAQRSKDDSYFPAGKSTQDIIGSICSKHGIKLSYAYGNIKHAKVAYKAITVSEMIHRTLTDAKSKLKENPVARFEKGVLQITRQGQNQDVYVFDASSSTISTNERITMDELVTKVVVVGKEDKQGRRKIEATLTGKTEYGTLQEIVQRDGDDTIAKTREEAQNILDEQGTPKHFITAEAPDVPEIKKGDKVKVMAGSLNGYYFVKGVTHDEASRTMVMELEKAKVVTASSSSGGEFNKGDTIILNGRVYATSYGERGGRTFNNYHGRITIKVNTSRKKPYHIDGIGWVDASNLIKA